MRTVFNFDPQKFKIVFFEVYSPFPVNLFWQEDTDSSALSISVFSERYLKARDSELRVRYDFSEPRLRDSKNMYFYEILQICVHVVLD